MDAVRVKALEISNYRAFESVGPLEFGRINVLVGANNGGKSSLLHALHLLQQGSSWSPSDVRIGSQAGASINVVLSDVAGHPILWKPQMGQSDVSVTLNIGGGLSTGVNWGPNTSGGFGQFPAEEPNHFVVPYFSRRKASGYNEDVRLRNAIAVDPSFHNLAARLARLGNPDFPSHEKYSDACREILGFVVTAIPSANGQQPGVYVSRDETIRVEAMGEGVPNIVGLLADLALAEGKLLLVEEVENDLHPTALKALLRLIVESSEVDGNQFVVSTHSNIVARHLASTADSRLFYVRTEGRGLPPLSVVNEVGPDPNARMAVLRDLGYELNDFNLWDGWIFLEESSAERIIRDHLIIWFAPQLAQRVRTMAADGNSGVEPAFDDFHRLIRFTHLEPAYRDRAWVLIDGDQGGLEIVARLRERYSGTWDLTRFRTFSQTNFEAYYPDRFDEARTAALAEPDKQARREKKRLLLEEVRTWIAGSPDEAKAEFEQSAAEVVAILRDISSELFGNNDRADGADTAF